MDVVKIGMLGIAGVLLAVLIKKEKGEYSLLISFLVCTLIFFFVVEKIKVVTAFIERLEALISIDSSYIVLILKMIGISYVAGFAMDVCKDAGYVAVGNQIEIFAKISILAVSLPVLLVFLETVSHLL